MLYPSCIQTNIVVNSVVGKLSGQAGTHLLPNMSRDPSSTINLIDISLAEHTFQTGSSAGGYCVCFVKFSTARCP
jgi:hypothetical protein